MSFRRLSARLLRDESGMGMVEIIVALMILAIVTIGMTGSMLSMTRLTSDAAARETATNLAAEEVDRVSSIDDAFTVVDATQPKQVTVDGIKFFVTTNTGWVGANGSTEKCGIGAGQLQYKRVRVTVTWDNMYLPNPVRADTALAPGDRINDPTAGTILISVKREGGGQQGVTVTAARSGGGGPTDPIDPTDSDGCAYVLKAPPGTYTLTLTKANFITTAQVPFPLSQTITVTAGTATSVPVQADVAQTYTLKYAANSTRTVKLPTNLDVTYFGQGATAPLNELAVSPRKLYPWGAGYQLLAGNPTTCAAVDPEKWVAKTTSPTLNPGVRVFATPATAGGTGNIPVAMGVVDVVMPGSGSTSSFLTATAQNVVTNGNPGCSAAATTVYKFASFGGGTTQTIALPYGVWKLTYGSTSGSTTSTITTGVIVRDAVISLDASGYPQTGITGGGSAFASNLLTLDPRKP